MGCGASKEMGSSSSAVRKRHASVDTPSVSARTGPDAGAAQGKRSSHTGIVNAADRKNLERGVSAASTNVNSPDAAKSNSNAIDSGMFITQQRAHLSDRYIREHKLGSGAYGEVVLCREKATGVARAVKIIRKSTIKNQSAQALLDEVQVVKQLDHPNIMKLYEFFEDKRFYYLVMEVYTGGELFDEIISRQKFDESDAAFVIKQVISGVCYLHRQNVVHRDLKPENLLLESKKPDALIKIVDFGLSSYFDPKQKLKERLGTAYYIAPEVLRKKYDHQCDIWSIGVIMYILLCGYPPFGGQSDQEILRRVEKGRFAFDPPEWKDVSEEAKDLIRKMLTYDPSRRITADDALNHPWFIKYAEVVTRTTEGEGRLRNALANMKKFQTGQKLAQAALLFMGSKLTTIEETTELTKIFRELDQNGDGQLDRKELVEGYRKMMEMKKDGTDTTETVFEEELTDEQIALEVDKILDTVDFDKNGFIEYSEFVTVAMDRRTLLSKGRLKAAFNLFDEDGSGKIAGEELRRILPNCDDAQWAAILGEVDQNGDGEIDFQEFVVMMQKLVTDR